MPKVSMAIIVNSGRKGREERRSEAGTSKGKSETYIDKL
jgi:hypothetical protein